MITFAVEWALIAAIISVMGGCNHRCEPSFNFQWNFNLIVSIEKCESAMVITFFADLGIDARWAELLILKFALIFLDHF